MIAIADLLAIARARLQDANVLYSNDRFDRAAYVCGYAVELALKARISMTLNWSGFHDKKSEFENFASFRTHKLDVLLRLSGQESRIKTDHLAEWSTIATWDPEVRYRPVGGVEPLEVVLMISSAETLLDAL